MRFFVLSGLKYFNKFKSIVFVLCMLFDFAAHAVSMHDSSHTTPTQQQKEDTTKSSLIEWFSKKYGCVVDFIGDIVSEPNLTTISACDENKDKDNNTHLYPLPFKMQNSASDEANGF